jgi:hypothetical protein
LSTALGAVVGLPELSSSAAAYDYLIYGLRVRSRVKLAATPIQKEGSADLELQPGGPSRFADAISQATIDDSDWIHLHELTDGWSYLRYDAMFDFLISPSGDLILYRLLAPVSSGCFQTYALGRVFSFALVKMGHEPLHAATIVVNGESVAFLGASTFGKSSLAACFVAGGHRLLSDDVLRVEECDGRYLAFAGPHCLKLFPRVARLYLGDITAGVPINNRGKVSKLLFQLSAEQSCALPVPLAAIYVITPPRRVYKRQQIRLGPLSPREALMSLVGFTHNHELTYRDRMQRQLDAAQRLIATVPIRSLAYPRVLSSLAEVRDAILVDLKYQPDLMHHADRI